MQMVGLLLCLFLALVNIASAAKKEKFVDPRECEVCIKNLETIDAMVAKEDKRNEDKIIDAIGKHCTSSGFGSEWKPNPGLTNPKDVKMCYYFEPIKKSVVKPFAMGMPKDKVCKRLKKDNPEICEVKYPIKVEKKEGEKTDYNSLRVKQLKTILDQRGVKCSGCTEKPEFVKKCEETEHLDI